MNTAIRIRNCNKLSAQGKHNYNVSRIKNEQSKNKIKILEDNGFPDTKALTKEQREYKRKLQRKLSSYKRRLKTAIKNGKDDTIATAKRNIEKIEKELKELEQGEGAKVKYYSEFIISLTNAHEYRKMLENDNWSSKVLEYLKNKYPDLNIISAVEHRDQYSPHMHVLLHSPGKPIRQYLSEVNGEKDLSKEAMQKAYSKMAHDLHDFVQEKVVPELKLSSLKKGRKYVSLGEFKERGNYEAIEKKKRKEEHDRHRNKINNQRNGIRVIRRRVEGTIQSVERAVEERHEQYLMANTIESNENSSKAVDLIRGAIERARARFEHIRSRVEELRRAVASVIDKRIKEEQQQKQHKQKQPNKFRIRR